MYAALHIPRLPLQAVLTFSPETWAADQAGSCPTAPGGAGLLNAKGLPPLVIVDAQAKKPVVLYMTPASEKEGVVIGLSIPQAMARCVELQVRYRSAQAEAMAWQALFHAAYSISPRLERISAGLCLVDLRGVTLAAAKARCAAIVDELAAMGLEVRIGVAASSSLAMLAAKQANGVLVVESGTEARRQEGEARPEPVAHIPYLVFLDALPMATADPDETVSAILEQWGIRTVGAFARLSRQALGARIGKRGLLLWDRVNGRDERVVGVVDLPLVFEESWKFEYDVDSLEPMLFLLRRFLDQLCLKLEVAHKLAAEVRMELELAYGEPIERKQKLPEPTRDREALFRLLSGRLENLDTDSPISGFSMRIDAIDFKQRQLGLFESSLKNPYRFTQTLARVAGIIGSDRVGRPVLEPDGRPDGFQLEALPSSVPPAGDVSLNITYGMPLRRFRSSMKAAVELQGRQPVWFRSEEASGFVKACRGPWLHSGHWWENEGGWNRVEWDVELRKGGVYRLVKEEGQWFLEGEYG